MMRRTPSTAWLLAGILVFLSIPSAAAAAVPMQNPQMARIETMAESVIDQFLHNDFKAAHHMLGMMRNAFDDLHRRASRKPYDERKERELATMHLWMRQMAIAIRNHSGIGGAIAANQLTAALIRYQDFPDAIKSSIAWMDYLSRDIVLLNMEDPQQNASLLAFRRNDLEVTWHTLRRLLLKDMRNKAVSLRVDKAVDHLASHLDRASQIADGNKLQALAGELARLHDPLQPGS
jgi:hypothetical protein